MKNNRLFAATLAASIIFYPSANALAQNDAAPAFKKGSKSIGLSAGFGIDYNYYGNIAKLPALAITYDQGFFDNIGPGNIGIGGIIGYKSANYKYNSGGYKATWTNIVIGVRGTYHLTLLKDKNNKFDPYAGVMLGFRINRYNDTYFDAFGGNLYSVGAVSVASGAFIGAKYNFARTLGAFAELGYDISLARIGLCLNF